MADLDDDLEPLVTECPNCSTRFRVSETQLAAADGRVRCGACLHVFQGNAHLLFESELGGPDDPDAELDALLSDLGDPDPDQVGDDLEGAPDELREESELGADLEEPLSELELPEVELTELTALDAQLAEPEPEPEPEPDPTDDDEMGIDAGDENGVEGDQELAELDAGVDSDHADDPNTEPALEPEAEPEADVEAEVVPVPSPAPEPAERPPATSEPEREETPEEIAARDQAEVEALLREYDLPQRRNWLAPVVIVGTLALIVEVFVLQFDDWVREPSLRPVYVFACDYLPCTVEPLRDVAAIRSLANEPRPDPNDADRMLIDLQFVSNAEFAQPFPTIEIQFRSRTGAPMGRETITPESYLMGDAANLTELAPRTPVRVTLSVGGSGSDSYIISYR